MRRTIGGGGTAWTRSPSAVSITPLSAVYPHQRHLPPKVRAFIDFLVDRFAAETEWAGHTTAGATGVR